MKIHLPEILQTFHSAEFLFFYRPRYNPLPLFAGLLIFALIVSFTTLPFVRAAGGDSQKKTALNFYFGVGIFSFLYGVLGLLYAAFVLAARAFGSDSFGKQLFWFDSLVSLSYFLLGLTVGGLLLLWLADKTLTRRSEKFVGQSADNAAAKDFVSLKLND